MSFILLKWFLIYLEPVLHYNLSTDAFKISTKIWGCHVRFPHHFYAKTSFGHWRFWAPHQFFKSGPVGILHYSLFKYSSKNSSKCWEMSVDAYNSTPCQNLVFSFDFRNPLLFNIVGFYLKWKLSKSTIGLVCPLYKNNSLSVDLFA